VNSLHRDGFHQDAVPGGVAPYKPNTLDGNNPFVAGADEGAYIEAPAPVEASVRERSAPASFDDHFSQARLFWRSMTPAEKEHIVLAYTFELGKCYEQVVKERQLRALANIDPVLCQQVATGLGLPAPEPTETLAATGPESSPALSQLGGTWPADGRMIGIVVDPDHGLDGVQAVRHEILAAGMVPLVIAPHGGMLEGDVAVQRTFGTGRSVEVDAVLLAGAPAPAPDAWAVRDSKAGAAGTTSVDPRVVLLLDEAHRHAKVVGAWGAGRDALAAAGLPTDDPGVVVGEDAQTVLGEVQQLLAQHRVWERFPASLGA